MTLAPLGITGNPDAFISPWVRDYIKVLDAPTCFLVDVMTTLVPYTLRITFDVLASCSKLTPSSPEDQLGPFTPVVTNNQFVLLHFRLL
jgi:hypothetical protein